MKKLNTLYNITIRRLYNAYFEKFIAGDPMAWCKRVDIEKKMGDLEKVLKLTKKCIFGLKRLEKTGKDSAVWIRLEQPAD